MPAFMRGVIITKTTVDGETTVLGALTDSVQDMLDLGADTLLPPPRWNETGN